MMRGSALGPDDLIVPALRGGFRSRHHALSYFHGDLDRLGLRLHEEDLSGHVLAQGGYEHLCLPSEYDPSRPAVTHYLAGGLGGETDRIGRGAETSSTTESSMRAVARLAPTATCRVGALHPAWPVGPSAGRLAGPPGTDPHAQVGRWAVGVNRAGETGGSRRGRRPRGLGRGRPRMAGESLWVPLGGWCRLRSVRFGGKRMPQAAAFRLPRRQLGKPCDDLLDRVR
jgi:hypothetical protein